MRTETTRPYTAMIPDITTGMSDYTKGVSSGSCRNSVWRTFIMSSGLNVPNPAIPMPAFEVPMAAPTAVVTTHAQHRLGHTIPRKHTAEDHLMSYIAYSVEVELRRDKTTHCRSDTRKTKEWRIRRTQRHRQDRGERRSDCKMVLSRAKPQRCDWPGRVTCSPTAVSGSSLDSLNKLSSGQGCARYTSVST